MLRFSVTATALVLAGLLLLSLIASLSFGALAIPLQQAMLALWDLISGGQSSQLEDYQQLVITELRLPRSLLAILVGIILAQCGAISQGLFRNPMADPGIIGVSAGAGVGAVVAIVWLAPLFGDWTIAAAAFAAGLVTSLTVYALAQTSYGTSVVVLLLAGVAISAFAGAALGFISYFADDANLRQLSLWQMGSLAAADNNDIFLAAACALILGIVWQYHAGDLNTLLLGEAEARHLGIEVEKLKFRLIVLVAVGMGVAVACAGMIGFVGLVIPHLVRICCGPNHRYLLPLCALAGALLLVIADLGARLLVIPAELPVGLVTALLGSPFFIVLLMQQRKSWQA